MACIQRISRIIACLVATAGSASADCIPEKMVKAVHVDATPGLDRTSFAAQPKTLYRLGTKYGRVEELPNTATGIHGLIVVKEPDIWMVNLLAKAGTHMVDTGAPYYFRAPIYIDPDSRFFTRMEFGCELAYLKAAGANPPRTTNLVGRDWDEYEVESGAESIRLLAMPKTDMPYLIVFYRDGKALFAIRFIEYSNTLPPDLSLFERPSGVTYQEAK